MGQVAGGDQHTAAGAEDGARWTFGRGGGRRGLPSPANHYEPTQVHGDLQGELVVSVACGAHHTAARTRGGALFTFGRGSAGQLGDGAGLSRTLGILVGSAAATYEDVRLSTALRGRPWDGWSSLCWTGASRFFVRAVKPCVCAEARAARAMLQNIEHK